MTSTQRGETGETRRAYLLAFLVIVAFPLAAFIGLTAFAFRPTPIGEPSECIVQATEQRWLRLRVQALEISQRDYEDHAFAISQDAGATWTPIFTNTRPEPPSATCEDNIQVFSETGLLAWNGAAVAVSDDGGATWRLWELCDEPRPSFGCVDREQIRAVTFESVQRGQVAVFAPEGSYQLETGDGGQSWQLSES